MKRTLPLLVLLIALLTSSLAFAQAAPDADGDGVPDMNDRCPTATGPAALQGCPDIDNDGVADIDDACPAIPGIPENTGCPTDSDQDGVGDFEDACPHTPGTVDNRGCPPDPAATPVPGTANAERNPLVPPTTGECVATPKLNGRVNGRSAPRADADIVIQLDPNAFYPIAGLVALPGQAEAYLKYKLENVMVSGVTQQPSTAFDPSFLGSVFIAASTMNIGGDCVPDIDLLLPAVQKVREMAIPETPDEEGRLRPGRAVLVVRKDRSDWDYTVTFSDLLISSFTDAADTASGAGKVSLQDFHFFYAHEDGDTLVFDFADTDPGDDFFLKLESAPTPTPDAAALVWLVNLLAAANSTDDGGAFDGCDAILIDALRNGATILAQPTDYGVEFFIRNPDGTSPECPDDETSLKYKLIDLISSSIAGTGDAQPDGFAPDHTGSLMKIGPGVLAIGDFGIAADGTICADFQPEGAAPMCVPAPLE